MEGVVLQLRYMKIETKNEQYCYMIFSVKSNVNVKNWIHYQYEKKFISVVYDDGNMLLSAC